MITCKLSLRVEYKTYVVPLDMEQDTGDVQEIPIVLKENDYVSIKCEIQNTLIQPVLWIQDCEWKKFDRTEAEGNTFKYIWEKQDIFRKHFGSCCFTILLGHGESIVKTFRFKAIDVISKQKVAGTQKIFSSLEEKMDRLLSDCFSDTLRRGGNRDLSARHPKTVLNEALECMELFEELIPAILKRPLRRLQSHSVLSPFDRVNRVREQSVSWLYCHPDEFYAGDRSDFASVLWENRPYKINHLMEEQNQGNPDVYENRIITGLLLNIIRRVQGIREYYALQEQHYKKRLWRNKQFQTDMPYNYRDFPSITAEFSISFCREQEEQCDLIISRANSILTTLQRIIDLPGIEESPRFTPGFQQNPAYRAIFEKAIDWYQLGELNLNGERYLFSITGIDKLYKFYCLSRMIETLQSMGYCLASTQDNMDNGNIGFRQHYYFTRRQGEAIEIWYEPYIGVGRSDIEKLVRRSGSFYYQPDFVLAAAHGREKVYTIIEAQYAALPKVKEDLPDLVFKYLHRLGSPEGGFSPVWFLFAACPANEDDADDPIYLQNHIAHAPIDLPCIGVLPINPGKNDSLYEFFEFILGTGRQV